MPALETPEARRGWKAAPFRLKNVDGKMIALEEARGPNGLLVMFICNHCPFVKAIMDRIVRDAKDLQAQGIGVIALNANDTGQYPEDSFENMQKLASAKGFSFPYVIDETQDVARAYGAVCTPDFFGFNSKLELEYRGRLDASRMDPLPDARRDLLEAMTQIAKTGKGPAQQYASMGCSIKWKEETGSKKAGKA
jgi:peroxiredoxin